jgi:hypothetical protein
MEFFLPILEKFGLPTALVAVIVALHFYNIRVTMPKLAASSEKDRKAFGDLMQAQHDDCREERKELLTAYREEAAALRTQFERELNADRMQAEKQLNAEREQHDRHISLLINYSKKGNQ